MAETAHTELKQIPLRHLHEQLGGKMVPFAGFLMPVRYSSDLDEHHAVRQRAGIFDVSHMGEFMAEGPEALAFVQHLVTNDVSKLVDGQAQYNVMCYENGTAVDDLIVYRIREDQYMLVVNAGNLEKDWDWVNKQNRFHCELKNVSDETCLFAVQGPKAVELLQTLTDTELSTIPYYNFRIGKMGGIDDVGMSNTGYTGAGGFEIYVNAKDAEALFNTIMEAGKPFGLQPIGLGARDTLRLEMGYALYGHELDDKTTPLEAGLAWVTKLNKAEDFVGKEALKAQKEAGLQKKLVGFVVEQKGGIPRAGYTLADEAGNDIGIVTSGTVSPTYGVGVGMGFVKPEFTKEGTMLQLKVRDRVFPARVAKLPPTAK